MIIVDSIRPCLKKVYLIEQFTFTQSSPRQEYFRGGESLSSYFLSPGHFVQRLPPDYKLGSINSRPRPICWTPRFVFQPTAYTVIQMN